MSSTCVKGMYMYLWTKMYGVCVNQVHSSMFCDVCGWIYVCVGVNGRRWHSIRQCVR